ncbi:hypothetical protein MKW98_017942 [Papaver atlanticum]|uniref:Protein kinase domain-containing protein n=1 Tax=Papaver atlanticum TaxID=357466 RepID=A0AAD4TC64_9MAGN|nr:hypothetical protein MKW98_017942 [Papaver atlanticum]
MAQVSLWVFLFSLLLVFQMIRSEEDDVKLALIKFYNQLAGGSGNSNLGWDMNTDPCTNWTGVSCNSKLTAVKKIVLDNLLLPGTLDADSLCTADSLTVLSLNNNTITGDIPQGMGGCTQLTHIHLSGNKLSGNLPGSLSNLNNLKRFDISHNNVSGVLPDFSRISGLVSFLVQNNSLTGEIPQFDFMNLQGFNVSFNNFTGPIPDLKGRFSLDSVMGNPGLCGSPLSNKCPPTKKESKITVEKVLTYSGYMILGLVILIFIVFKLVSNKTPKNEKLHDVAKMESGIESSSKNQSKVTSSDYKSDAIRSEYSITSETGMVSSSLVVLTSPIVKGLKFEDLLKAPAELLGRGRHGSLYKVIFEDGMTLAVKRIKDWSISSEEFKSRMQRIDQAKHPNVMDLVAFYCSKQEKLVVYNYQHNGSLFKLLHENENVGRFDWGSRLSVSATIAETLAFMHEKLYADGIPHGNLKSSNIVFNKNMDPCISEYGLMIVEHQDYSSTSSVQSGSFKSTTQSKDGMNSTFEVDIYGYGVLLLELLTGKQVQNNGVDLARWVNSVVREEWTAEVFDKVLIREGASEERMLHLLQVALKCIDPAQESTRPTMKEVAEMMNIIKEDEEERSIDVYE